MERPQKMRGRQKVDASQRSTEPLGGWGGGGGFWFVGPPLEIMVPLEKVPFLPFKVLQEDPLLPDSQPCSDVVEYSDGKLTGASG